VTVRTQQLVAARRSGGGASLTTEYTVASGSRVIVKEIVVTTQVVSGSGTGTLMAVSAGPGADPQIHVVKQQGLLETLRTPTWLVLNAGDTIKWFSNPATGTTAWLSVSGAVLQLP
jgi:hypothetical protein